MTYVKTGIGLKKETYLTYNSKMSSKDKIKLNFEIEFEEKTHCKYNSLQYNLKTVTLGIYLQERIYLT